MNKSNVFFFKVCCAVLLLVVAQSYGRPGVLESNVGGSVQYGWDVGGHLGYDMESDENGFDLNAGAKGLWGATGGTGVGLQIGQNGPYGGNGIAVAGKAGAKTRALAKAGINGRIGKKLMDASGKVGSQIGANVGANKGFYFTPRTAEVDPWSRLGNWGTPYGYPSYHQESSPYGYFR